MTTYVNHLVLQHTAKVTQDFFEARKWDFVLFFCNVQVINLT